jgi:hypothetical protein
MMELRVPVEKLERCPSCRSRRLVVAVYRLQEDPLGGDPTLECEGCCSVVRDLSPAELLRMRDTEAGKKILAREMSR